MEWLVFMADAEVDWTDIIVAVITAVGTVAAGILAYLGSRAVKGGSEATLEAAFVPAEAIGEAVVANPEVFEALIVTWGTLTGGPVAGKKMLDAVREVHDMRQGERADPRPRPRARRVRQRPH